MAKTTRQINRILFVDQAGNLYGSEKGLLALLEYPRPVGFDAVLVCPDGALAHAVEHLVIAREKFEFNGSTWRRRPDWQLRTLFKFIRILGHYNPDIVVINFEGNVPLLVLGCLLAKRPVVRMLKREIQSDGTNYILGKTDLWSFKNCAGVVCISGTVERQLRSALNASSTFPVVTLYDPQEITSVPLDACAAKRQELGLPENALVVGQFARICPGKGYETLIKAAALVTKSLPDVWFLMVGGTDGTARSTTYLDYLKELARQLGLGNKVIWTGLVPDPMTVMAACDLTVLSTHQEGLGRVIIESWATGRPVLASDTGGPAEIVRLSGGGLLHPVGDHESLARHLLLLLGDEEQRQTLADAGRAWTRINCDPVNYRHRFHEALTRFAN